ncbi:SDR family NAD(P)-dependent oxidoreductase [Halomonas cupida]|uniref:Dihydroanticapsin 7-dehydrogenase n=2 Tax=Halomonas cupida TaxID=44933 RepID=A0ABQ0WKQ8_9GAMM|nr:SDR family oxidoreductase [Halomonas cupida]GEN26321.1 dihydroanticapsin 7-dehydrogenase [Halomonas cupida]
MMDLNREFEGRVAIVTGAAGGVGSALVRLFADRGASVVAEDVKAEVGELERYSERIVTLCGDLSEEQTATRAVKLALERFGRLDILVNNAALIINRRVAEMTLEDWDSVLNVNLRGTFLHSREAMKVMTDAKRGSIVNVGSYACHVAFPTIGAYAASKGAIAQLTRVLALEGAEHGIRANVVAPGDVVTGILDDIMPNGRDFLAEHGASSPAGRAAQPDEIAEVIAFAACDRASYMTGSIVMADGGYTSV